MTRFLLSNGEDGLFLLSERFSQDPYYGKQRTRGGRNENPNIQQCMVNAAALRIQGSVALDPVRGNCRRKRHMEIDESSVIDCPPLPKRKRSNHKKKALKCKTLGGIICRSHMRIYCACACECLAAPSRPSPVSRLFHAGCTSS